MYVCAYCLYIWMCRCMCVHTVYIYECVDVWMHSWTDERVQSCSGVTVAVVSVVSVVSGPESVPPGQQQLCWQQSVGAPRLHEHLQRLLPQPAVAVWEDQRHGAGPLQPGSGLGPRRTGTWPCSRIQSRTSSCVTHSGLRPTRSADFMMYTLQFTHYNIHPG